MHGEQWHSHCVGEEEGKKGKVEKIGFKAEWPKLRDLENFGPHLPAIIIHFIYSGKYSIPARLKFDLTIAVIKIPPLHLHHVFPFRWPAQNVLGAEARCCRD